jgi:hypothetical protein
MTRQAIWTRRQVNELKSLYEIGIPNQAIAKALVPEKEVDV